VDVRLVPDDDEREFASTLRRLLSDGPDSPRLWDALAGAGVLGLTLSEEHGGSGGTLSDLGTFYLEAGRGLCPMTVHGTIQAALVVDTLGTPEQRATLLPPLAAGKRSATTALSSPMNAGDVTPVLRADADGDGWRLTGCVDFVLDGQNVDLLVVSGTDSGTGRMLVFAVPATADALRAEPLTMMGGQAAARFEFGGVRVEGADVLGSGGEITDEQLHRIANTASALLSLDLVGVAEAAIQRTVDYTSMRHQFGRPIASFQAAQHLVADMHIAVAAARLAGRAAVSLLAEGHTATRQTAVARMHAAGAAKLATLDAHQLHGGMGYVVDTDLHKFSERARVLSTLGGGADVAATWLEKVVVDHER
jgi:alkylation response protein AidB-like acyl-CoA dehydrogenase